MGKIVSYSELKKTFPEEKKAVESIYGIIVPVRKISYIFTIPMLALGVTAFQASIISIFIAVAACICLCIPSPVFRVIGVILVPMWHIFDCVDGNIARYNKTASDFGGVVDAISGYFMMALLPIGLGMAAFNVGHGYLPIPKELYILMGGIGATTDVLARLIHQKYAFTAMKLEKETGKHIEKGDNQYHLTGFNRFRKMIGVELGIVGIPMFVLWLAPIFNLYHILTIYYCLFHAGSVVMIAAYYLRKCNKAG